MPEFQFSPSVSSVSPATLEANSTTAKIIFYPKEIFVDTEIHPADPGNHAGPWKVRVDSVPRQNQVPVEDQSAILLLTRGELGKEIGRIQLGPVY
jgi:hypothetical protein